MANNDMQAEKILDQMIQFIKQHGLEEVERIKSQEKDEFTIQKNSHMMEDREKIKKNMKTQLENEEVRMKIEKSKQQNQLRIDKMRKVNEYVEMLKTETIAKIREEMKSDAGAYKTLLKDLLVQVSNQTYFYVNIK